MGHQAFLLDVFFGLPYDSDKLEEIFDRPDGGLEISKGISTSVPDLGALRKSRPDQSPSEIGPNVIELCQMADITFMALRQAKCAKFFTFLCDAAHRKTRLPFFRKACF